MRRVPEPESTRWAHMSLYLRSKDFSVPGVWMEDYKFLAAYKLKTTVRDFYTHTHTHTDTDRVLYCHALFSISGYWHR